MAPMNALALAACLLCVATGLAMTFLVLRESPRSRDSQLMAAYFLAAATGAGAVFLARVSALIGADASPYFYASYDAMALAFCALLALATHYAGLWRRRWIPLLLRGGVALVLLGQVPLMSQGRLVHLRGYDAAGQVEMHLSGLGEVVLVAVVSIGLLLILAVLPHRRARGLIPGVATAVVGLILQALVPQLRPFPVALLSAALSMVLLTHCLLRENPFDPMTRSNADLQRARGRSASPSSRSCAPSPTPSRAT